ncbi:hypothetical protein SRABI80_04075 [Peribacillus frigoritolerans]|nr:hypothetical protein SRABI80_04075 [Peribacillus frigoritolerans]
MLLLSNTFPNQPLVIYKLNQKFNEYVIHKGGAAAEVWIDTACQLSK